MTQEEKELLIKDLCERLPYGVMYDNGPERPKKLLPVSPYSIEDIKLYLRPMSSMTEEEKEELMEEHKKDEKTFMEVIERVANGDERAKGTAIPHFATDWCNEHHFDYRGLIEKGLALEAPKDMYKTFI